MTIWFDFTTTLRNTGRNGIAAAEWNLGMAVLDGTPDARCFALDSRRGLIEIDPRVDLTRAFYASPSAIAPPTVTPGTPTWRSHVRLALRGSLGTLADPLIGAMNWLRSLPRRARRAVAHVLNRSARAVSRPSLPRRIGPGDVVVSIGADWSGELLAQLRDLKASTGCRVVTMVYDLIPVTHRHLAFHNEPQMFVAYYERLASVSDLITCISQQTRRDLVRVAAERGWALPPTEVLLLGEAVPGEPAAEELGDFYLWVGTVERRKNLDLIYDALRIIESEGVVVPTVVVAGAVGWGVDDLIAELDAQSTEASRSIVMLGSVDEVTLDHLYKRARALVFPSHYEGWGLPVRDAAVRGCPVVAGDSPAVREALLGYEAAELLPTDDPGPWADYLRRSPSRSPQAAPIHTWAAAAAQLTGHVTQIAWQRAAEGRR